MTRFAFGCLVLGSAALLLGAGPASAQSPASSPGVSSGQPAGGATPDTQNAPPDVADHPGANGAAAAAGGVPTTALPGVTVTKRNKPCAKNDPACYEAVSAEIWRKYPQQIATMCKDERIRRMRLGFQETELGLDGSQVNRLTPQTEALCDYGPAHGLSAK